MIAFVQARMSSQRLPGKVLMPLLGKPMLQYLIESLSHSETITHTVVLTSTDTSDGAIQRFCDAANATCFRGALEDVAARFLAAAAHFHADAFVRISGDSPLLDHRIVDRAVRLFHQSPCDLATNVLVRTFPKGQSVEVVSHAALRDAHQAMTLDERQHVTQYFYADGSRFAIRDFQFGRNCGDVRMAVDTEEDFMRVERCMEKLGREPWRTPLIQILENF